jgi:2-methylcitrate dehydratase PrpD
MNSTQIYSKFLVDTQYQDLPLSETQRFKIRLLDSIGVIAAGTHAPGIEKTISLLKYQGGVEEGTICFHGGKIPAGQAAFINGMMMRSFDFEIAGGELPDRTTGPAHISGSSIPCVLAAAELTHASGKDAILANVLGDDLAARLAQGTHFSFENGWDNTGTINGLGCTAIAAKLLKLDEEQCRNAFGIAINLLGGSIDIVKDGVMAFKFPHGMSAKNGIFSSQLAQIGFTGTKDGICGRHGYFSLFGGDNKNPDTVITGLGETYYSDGDIKPYPSCRFTHSPIQATLQLIKEHNIKSEDIAKIIIHPHSITTLVDKPFVPSSIPQLDGLFNVRYVVAIAATQGAVLPKHHSAEYQSLPEVRRIIDCIDIVYDVEHVDFLSINLDIILKNGTKYSTYLKRPKGGFLDDPLTYEELLAKYYSNIEYSGLVSPDRADQIVKAIEKFEDIDDVNDFTALLTP